MLGWELPPNNSGGLGVACYHLCKALSKKAVDIEFILPYTAEHDIDFMRINAAHPQDVEAVLKSGIAYDSFKYVKHSGEVESVDLFGQTVLYEKAVERISRESEFDVIHAHDWLTCRAALRAQELTGKPLIVHLHSIESDRAGKEFGGNPLVREIESLAIHMADQVIAVSELTKRGIVREYGIAPDKIKVVHNSMDVDNLESLDVSNAYHYLTALRQQGWHVVVNVGRLTVQKGVVNLLKAARLVIDQQPKTLFLIVGNGEQEHELIELAASLGISKNVIFTGFLRGKQWRDAFAISDLFVMPSVSEPFGITPLEAIGYGTPALITRQSGVAEVLQNCLKIDYWDVEGMANQIVAVVEHESLHRELQINGYRELERLSWDDAAIKLANVYNQQTESVGA